MDFSDLGFARALQKLCTEGGTGTLFVLTEDNHQARIGFDRGRIVHVVLNRLRGIAAVREFAHTALRSFLFRPEVTQARQEDLPATDEIVSLMTSRQHALPAAAQAPAAAVDHGASMRAAVTAELAEFVGPMARLLVEDHREVSDVDTLLARVIPHLDSPAEAARLIARVKARLA